MTFEPFEIDIPTRAAFGWGARRGVVDCVRRLASRKVLIISSETMLARPLVAELVGQLRETGAELREFTGVSPNPDLESVDRCVRLHAGAGVDHVIGIGGGSALDLAKAAAAAIGSGKCVRELLNSAAPARPFPLTLVPTTSGTGSELSFGAILSDLERGAKVGLRGRNVAATHAFVDPELTVSTPPRVTAITGFDVLTHALETYLSNRASAFTEALSRRAIEIVFARLVEAYAEPNSTAARTEMSYASMIMGINLAHSTTCLPHRLQYPVGAATGTSHGEGLAALYPAWLRAVTPRAVVKLAACAGWIGIRAAEPADAAREFVERVLNLMDAISLRPSLSQLGVTTAMAGEFVDRVSGDLSADPGYVSRDSLRKIYFDSL